MNRSRRVWLFAVLPLLLAGCGERSGDVRGRVTVDGKPLTSGTVVFHTPRGEPTLCWIDADGSYSLRGLPLGTSRVSVGAFAGMPEGFRLKQKLPPTNGGPRVAPPERTEPSEAVPPRYGDPEESGLSCEVHPGETIYDIALAKASKKRSSRP